MGRLLAVPTSPRFGLERMRELLARLDEPQQAFRALHVAGTNGKGSVVAFADAMLRAAGLRTGRTTSPHLTCARERIVVDGELIDEGRFADLEEGVARACSAMEDVPTFFERMIAMAFVAFAEQRVDVAVVEVGLGGRLDATNTVLPRATAITRIGLDHVQLLGDTVDAIAREKAGILKPGVPAVSSPQGDDARAALVDVARRVGAPLRFVERPLDESVALGFGFGRVARENAAVACALVEDAGLVSELGGLARAHWPGRYERLSAAPLVVVDGAHNPDGMRALAGTVAEDARMKGLPLHVVVGMTAGHAGEAFGAELRALAPASVTTVQARAPRSKPARELAGELGLDAVACGSVDEGLARATARALADGGAVVVTGSLYLVGEVRARFVATERDPALPRF